MHCNLSQTKIISYLKAGYLLHLITFLELAGFGLFYYWVDVSAWLNSGPIFLKLLALSPTIGMPLFAQLDARSRFQDYKLMKDRFYLYGFQPRIVKPFMKSRCQRDAARAAASELGLSAQCNLFFQKQGYKWFNLFPDIVFEDPKLLLTKNFWSTTLFAKTYHSRIDYMTRPQKPAILSKPIPGVEVTAA